ncbi:MAG: hypothetical protein QNJ98_05680 [Planctomycetota bacterium]|nr:hypothetical protein [Planctomycetota bacterium]
MRSIWIRFVALFAALLLVPACAAGGACCGCEAEAPCEPAVADVEPVSDMCEGEPARPPEAKPGEAWCRVWSPPEYKTVTERVMVKPAVRKKLWIPPEYGSRMKIVCVSPAKLAETMRPGLYTTRTKDVLECPPTEYVEKVDCANGGKQADGTVQCECYQKKVRGPTFRTETERVCLQPAQRCLSYKPAEYKCVEERVLLKEGFCQTICEPAQYEDRMRQVLVKPGCWRWVRNEDCEVPEESLPALEVRMEDKAPDGSDAGVFKMGTLVRYDLVVLSDVASKSMPNLKVIFSLPEHLEFVEGSGTGITVTGAGQSAQSAVFPLNASETKELQLIARVIGVPPTNLVQLEASVQTEDGTELALETESTTLAKGE